MLENLKQMLGITGYASDDKLNLIIAQVTARLKNLLGGITPPRELDYIILEVSIARFNRIGSEGLSSHSVEGESLSFAADDFEQYSDDIQAYLDTQKETTRGKLRFL